MKWRGVSGTGDLETENGGTPTEEEMRDLILNKVGIIDLIN